VSCDQDDVRQIARQLPGAREGRDRFGFGVEHKGKERGFVWVWRERIHPKKARVPQPKVLAVRVAGPNDKATLLAADEEKFFTEDHYNGYPAVLVRLEAVSRGELERLVIEAWRFMAPPALVAAYDAGEAAGEPAAQTPTKPRAAKPKPPAAKAARPPAAKPARPSTAKPAKPRAAKPKPAKKPARAAAR